MPVLLPKEDTLLLASLTSRFCDYGEDSGVRGPPTSGQGSRFSAQSSGPEMQDSFMQEINAPGPRAAAYSRPTTG